MARRRRRGAKAALVKVPDGAQHPTLQCSHNTVIQLCALPSVKRGMRHEYRKRMAGVDCTSTSRTSWHVLRTFRTMSPGLAVTLRCRLRVEAAGDGVLGLPACGGCSGSCSGDASEGDASAGCRSGDCGGEAGDCGGGRAAPGVCASSGCIGDAQSVGCAEAAAAGELGEVGGRAGLPSGNK